MRALRATASDKLRQWFAPSCVLCDAVSDDCISLCTACQKDLPWLLHTCERCAIPLENTQLSVCTQCELNPPAVDSVFCALHYATPVDYLVKRMKFGHQLVYAKILGQLLARELGQRNLDQPDVILPVPLHNARLRSRGFNQTVELYREIQQHFLIPQFKGTLRIKNTKAQTKTKGEERSSNLQGAFALKANIEVPRHIAILDDVITTGATTHSLAQLLKEEGAEKVSVWAVARATERA